MSTTAMRTGRTFRILMLTQVVSLIGSTMTSVAIGIRVFIETGNSTAVLLVSFFAALPIMVASSVAGVLVDRSDRRFVLVACDTGQAIGTLLLLISFLSGSFRLWHLYSVAAMQGLLAMVQRPAIEATVALLVPPHQLDRANVIRQMAGPTAGTIAPVLAGALFALVGVVGIMAIDLATFGVAVAVVMRISIPHPGVEPGMPARTSIWNDYHSRLQFLMQRPILLYLMAYAATLNFLLAGPIGLATPYVLVLTGSEHLLGLLLGLLNVGILTGGVVVAIWGGTRPRIHGIMLGLLFRSACLALLGLSRTPVALGAAMFFVFFSNALVDASLASLLQLKVPATMQGRIFAIFFQLMYITNPLSLAATGPLVDRLLEPAVSTPQWRIVAPLVGNVPGSGMGLLMLIAGSFMFVLTACVYAHPATRHVEQTLPDQSAVLLEAPGQAG